MSAQGRFPLFSSRKLLITIITASLVAIAILSISLILYQQYIKSQSSVKITREDAISLTISEAKRMNFQPMLDTDGENTISAKLIHVDNNALGLIVDENWMTDTFTITDRWPPIYKNHYIWQVKITSSQQENGNMDKEWESGIDATNGTVIWSAINGGAIS